MYIYMRYCGHVHVHCMVCARQHRRTGGTCRAAFRHMPPPPSLNSWPPCNIKQSAQQISFVVKYLSENAPELISESLKLKLSWRNMSPQLAMCLHTWMGASTPFISLVPVLPLPGNVSECNTDMGHSQYVCVKTGHMISVSPLLTIQIIHQC